MSDNINEFILACNVPTDWAACSDESFAHTPMREDNKGRLIRWPNIVEQRFLPWILRDGWAH